MKRLIRLERKRLRKATIERIREHGVGGGGLGWGTSLILGILKSKEETISN